MPYWVYGFIHQFVNLLFTALIIAIVARALLSWFNLAPGNRLSVILEEITEPIIAPIRRVMPRMGMLDLSPLVAIILLQVIQSLLLQILS
ncbi:MAG: YggT family protein [Chloroflexi bacterium]|nr:YggT family protein [Chloroflexota bacterium]